MDQVTTSFEHREHPDAFREDDVVTIAVTGTIEAIGVQFYDLCRGPAGGHERDADNIRVSCRVTSAALAEVAMADGETEMQVVPRSCSWELSGRCRQKAGEVAVKYHGAEPVNAEAVGHPVYNIGSGYMVTSASQEAAAKEPAHRGSLKPNEKYL